MELYHGSIEKVKKHEIRKSNRTLDYGQGKLVDQYLFHTRKALDILTFIEA